MNLVAVAIVLPVWPNTVRKLVDQKYHRILEHIVFYLCRLWFFLLILIDTATMQVERLTCRYLPWIASNMLWT